MGNKKTIEKITFNANVDGRWYNRVDVGITPNNGYTNLDIDNGACFSTRIGKDYFDVNIKYNKNKKRYFINVTLFERDENGNWVKANEQKNVRINNVRVKFCDREFI